MLTYDFHNMAKENVKSYVELILRDLRSELSLQEECLLHYSLQLGIWEILINIIDHSPKAAANCHTHITIRWTDSDIVLKITNRGSGFDWRKCLMTGLPSPAQQRGRGLYIIQSISKHFTFDENGESANITFARK
ncbi:ATP-binding protein [Aneurinibacillus migulanus]|uniref:ATP-binding protein n=1 Tax=Aneurinibacillus migulanus TaxID=47500 RepID=UPI002E2382EA|nr:ATP-binding protein [Aneurinibacillus migulanus]